jgi:hypothetical protein
MVTEEQAQSIVATAAEQIENDPRIAVIRIMRRCRPPRTWREIGRKLGMSAMGALRLYGRATA